MTKTVKTLLVLLVALGLSACKPPIVGSWRIEKVTPCALAYQSEIEFIKDGTYVASGLGIWTGGTYTLVEHNRIRMDTALGATMYNLAIRGDRMVFTNSSGCTFAYLRDTPSTSMEALHPANGRTADGLGTTNPEVRQPAESVLTRYRGPRATWDRDLPRRTGAYRFRAAFRSVWA